MGEKLRTEVTGTKQVVVLVVLTRDGRSRLETLARVAGVDVNEWLQVLVIDSESADGTAELASKEGWVYHRVGRREFDHGATRRLAWEIVRRWHGAGRVLAFLTQDAEPRHADDLLRLASAVEVDRVGAAYGRQLPRPGAGPFEAHARLFNYPERSEVRSLEDARRLGIKACFFSDSFAAYRLEALEQVGSFPERAIVGEDVIVAAKLLKAGWKIAYVAEACVYHSHDLSPLQEMRRYFDIGVFHARERWILREFGKPEGEGLRFLRSELRYLREHAPWRIPESFLRAALKYLGYRLGRWERWLPLRLKRAISLQKHFWDREAEELRARKPREGRRAG